MKQGVHAGAQRGGARLAPGRRFGHNGEVRLVGEELAATDAGECTRIVTWYRHGRTYRVRLAPRGGPPRPRGAPRRAAGPG